MKATPAISKRNLSDVKKNSFPVVGIGASAGGLEAITLLLQNLPADTGMAFIYVQHLSPDHKSILTALLAKSTLMKVQEVTNKILMKPDNLYVIPPDKDMAVLDGHIRLTPRKKDHLFSLPIDTFLCSLAETHKENAIGIILSGSASDGTRGMKAIKHEGGLTFAQDDSAKFNSMPKSAIAAGVVDFILSPKEIAQELARLSKHPFVKTKGEKKAKEDFIDNSDLDLKIILRHLYKATGVDFSAYKMNTIKRRIIRRMLLYKIRTLKEYANLLGEKSDEIDILYQDLLINVTSFFRDTDTHQFLKTTLLPQLLKSKKPGETLRIWVPACSTGEEAYSIAMMLIEIQGSNFTNIPVQIFATDLSVQAISKARIGVYSKQEIEPVSPKRLQRFYTKSDGGYRIVKAVRDMCVFASHNILSDPPFSRIDFISCCNLFIYLDTTAQKKAATTFRFALKENGYLMLGKSETIGSSAHFFTCFNKKFKIFARKKDSDNSTLPALTPHFTNPAVQEEDLRADETKNFTLSKKELPVASHGLDSAIDAVLVSEFMPASVVINHEMEILQFRGSTDLYLTHSPGKATFNILRMARPEIAFELRNAISKAIKTKQRIRKSGIEMKVDDIVRMISIEVVTLSIEWDEPLVLILFTEPEQVEKVAQNSKGGSTNSLAKDRRIKKLEEELAAVRADMRAFAQEQEAFTEELQSASEEVVSSNEELQTVNEELETSKEEIESTNEELISANQELQTRNDLLNESYEYSEAIITNIHEPMIIIDKNLRVKSANKSFYKDFQVKEEDTEGTLLYDLGNKQWNIPRLRELLEDIIQKDSHFRDFEVKHKFPGIGEKIMLLNASRIIQKTHGEQLILLAIHDITEHALLQQREKELLKKDINESKSYNIKLEKAIEERTKEIEQANKTLEGKNYELDKMNKELQAFAYISSHDLQEPLRKIQTFVSLISKEEQKNLSETGKEHFRRMEETAQRMQSLIDDLLDYSRTSTAERKFESTDLNNIMNDVIKDFKQDILEKKAKIDAVNLSKANIIPFQFRQLLHNLVGNSLRFSNPKKRLHITIKSKISKGNHLSNEKLSSKTTYCHITVSDNGIGFDNRYKDRIFEVFQRLHSKEEFTGTGSGLAIVKRIVENHNGIITATGKLNKGARFDIYIPAD